MSVVSGAQKLVGREWPMAALGDIAKVFNGKTPSKSEQRSSGSPVLKIKDIDDQGNFKGFQSFVDHTLLRRYRSKCIRHDDTLILNAAHNADYVGSKLFRAGREVEDSLATGEWTIARATDNQLDRGYLWHWFNTGQARFMIRNAVKGIHLYPRDVADFAIPLPPLEAQKRIAAILDKAHAIRRKRAQTLAHTDTFLHSIFSELVGPNSSAYLRWTECTFEELARPEKGSIRSGPFGSDLKHSEFVKHGIAVLGIDNAVMNKFAWGERRFITEEKYKKLQRYTVYPGDVIVTIMGTTGRSAVVPDDIPAAITTKHLATISLDRRKATPEFISACFSMHDAVGRQIRSANKGAIMDGLNLGIIKNLTVRLPPLSVQQQWTDLHRTVCHMRSTIEDALHADELMTGALQSILLA